MATRRNLSAVHRPKFPHAQLSELIAWFKQMTSETSVNTQTWLVTVCLTGIGREIVLWALERNQRFVATGRSAKRLAELEAKGADIYEIDVNASVAEIQDFVLRVLQKYVTIDVLVNAGYVQNEETGCATIS